MSIKLITYKSIDEKNRVEKKYFVRLTSNESLIHTLNVMDFMAALSHNNRRVDDGIDWIVLRMKQK